jgi:hypothetical protein
LARPNVKSATLRPAAYPLLQKHRVRQTKPGVFWAKTYVIGGCEVAPATTLAISGDANVASTKKLSHPEASSIIKFPSQRRRHVEQ